jgi:hypothetical protein
LKNLELAHYVDRLQDENDELRKMMGWLSGHEPQLRMMIEAYKCYDGQALGLEKVGECSGEGGERLVISKLHQKPSTKMPMLLSPTHWKTNLTQHQILPYFLTQQMISKNR